MEEFEKVFGENFEKDLEEKHCNIFVKITATIMELLCVAVIISLIMMSYDIYEKAYDFGSHFWDSFYIEHELSR